MIKTRRNYAIILRSWKYGFYFGTVPKPTRITSFEVALFYDISSGCPVFSGETITDEAFQFSDASVSFQPFGHVLQLVLLTGRPDRLTEAMRALLTPPTTLLFADPAML